MAWEPWLRIDKEESRRDDKEPEKMNAGNKLDEPKLRIWKTEVTHDSMVKMNMVKVQESNG